MQHDTDVAKPEFWKHPFRVPITGDSDTDTATTVRIMCGHIKDGARDAAVQWTAQEAVAMFAGFGGINLVIESQVSSAWWWCKTFIKFVHHDFILRQRLGEVGHLQGLIAPEILVRMDQPEGDCAIFTECLCAFLRVIGVPYEIVTVAVNPQEPEVFSHVYAYAILENGSRLPLDASHGDYPGWQVPSAQVSRRQVWDADGNPVADRGSRFDGLHNYVLRGGGLGDVCSATDPDFDPVACANLISSYPAPTPTTTFPAAGACTCVNGTCIEDGNSCSTPSTLPAGSLTVPSQNSAQWASFAAAIAKMGFTLQQQAQLKPGQVILPNGTILQQAPGLPVPIGSQIATSLGSGNTLLYLGLGAVLLVGLSMMGGRR